MSGLGTMTRRVARAWPVQGGFASSYINPSKHTISPTDQHSLIDSATSKKGTERIMPDLCNGLGIFFMGTKTHRCAEIPGAPIAQGNWGNGQNGIAVTSF